MLCGLVFAFRAGFDSGLEAVQIFSQLGILAAAAGLMLAAAFYAFVTLPRTIISRWKGRAPSEASQPAALIATPGKDDSSEKSHPQAAVDISREALPDVQPGATALEPTPVSSGTETPSTPPVTGGLLAALPREKSPEPPQHQHSLLQSITAATSPLGADNAPVQREPEWPRGDQGEASPWRGGTSPVSVPEAQVNREPEHVPQSLDLAPAVSMTPAPAGVSGELSVPARVGIEPPHEVEPPLVSQADEAHAAVTPPGEANFLSSDPQPSLSSGAGHQTEPPEAPPISHSPKFDEAPAAPQTPPVVAVEASPAAPRDVPVTQEPPTLTLPGDAPQSERPVAPQAQVESGPSLAKKFMTWLPFSRREKSAAAAESEAAAATQSARESAPGVEVSKHQEPPSLAPASVREDLAPETPAPVVPPSVAVTASPVADSPVTAPTPIGVVQLHRSEVHSAEPAVSEPVSALVGRDPAPGLQGGGTPRGETELSPPPQTAPAPLSSVPRQAPPDAAASVHAREVGNPLGEGPSVQASRPAEAPPAASKQRDLPTDDIADQVWTALEKVHTTFMQRADSELQALYQARKFEQARRRERELRAKEAELRSYLEAEWRKYCNVDLTADAQREF